MVTRITLRARVRSALVALLAVAAVAAIALPAPAQPATRKSNPSVSGRRVNPSTGRRRRGPHTPANPNPQTAIASADASGNAGNALSTNPSISTDGRWVAFQSDAWNLGVPRLTGGTNVYVKDTLTGTVSPVTSDCASCGGQNPSISADGRYVTFDSGGTGFGVQDTNGVSDIYLRDMSSGLFYRMSVDSSGNQAINGGSSYAAISPDGNWVAFQSDATNLVANDTNSVTDVFVHSRTGGQTYRVSVDSSGNQGNGASRTNFAMREIVTNAGTVAFQSSASNLVPADTNNQDDVFVHTLAGSTVLADANNSGAQASTGADSPALSPDGRYVAFDSYSNLSGDPVPVCFGNSNLCPEVYVRDLQANTTKLASSDASGTPSSGTVQQNPFISGNDRYVSFGSNAALLPSDTNSVEDVYLKDFQTGGINRVNLSSSGAQDQGSGTSSAVLSTDAIYAAFPSGAIGLVSPQPDYWNQVYWRYNPTPSVPPGQLLGCLACQEARAAQALDSLGRALGVAGEPVNLANGSFFQSQRDAAMPNIGVPFTFTRTYNSADATTIQGVPPGGGSNEDQPIPISQGWTSTYNIYLRQSDWSGDLVLHGADGQQVVFLKQTNGSFLGGQGVGDTLTKNGDSTYTIVRHDSVRYQFSTGGNITSIKDRNSQGLTFSYTSGHITSISGNSAWTVTLGYTGSQLTSISLPLSRSVGYHYNSSGLLDQVTDVRGNHLAFAYTTSADAPQPQNLVMTITDQNNNVITQNTYGADGRVVESDRRPQSHSVLWMEPANAGGNVYGWPRQSLDVHVLKRHSNQDRRPAR